MDLIWSWDWFQVSDEMRPLQFSSQAGEGHFVAGNVFSGVSHIGPDVFCTPSDASPFEGLAIPESSDSRLSSDDTSEGGSSCAFAITLTQPSYTSILWQTPHWSSKILLPTAGSPPSGMVTSGSFIPPFFFPPIFNNNINSGLLSSI